MSETKPAKPKKKTPLYVFYGLLTVGILFFILSMNDLGEIFGVLKTANARYILVALLLLLIYLALYPLTLCFLAKAKGVNVKRSDVYFIGMTEHFFKICFFKPYHFLSLICKVNSVTFCLFVIYKLCNCRMIAAHSTSGGI